MKKNKKLTKFLALILTLFMSFSIFVVSLTCEAAEVTDYNNSYSYVRYAKKPSKKSVKKPTYTETLQQNNEYLKQLKVQQAGPYFKDSLLALTEIKGVFTGDDVDWIAMGSEVLSSAIIAVASYYGFGGVAEGVIGLIDTFLPGETPKSEMDVLTDNINNQFAEVREELLKLQNQISDLSDELNESTNVIIEALGNELDYRDAKKMLNDFMSTSDGGFGYNRFSNYVNGTNDPSNIRYKEAYYSQIQNSQYNNLSEEEVQEIFNNLYSSLMNSTSSNDSQVQMFYEYVLGDTTSYSKSIVKSFYDCVSSQRETNLEYSPEYQALKFAKQIYSTAYKVNFIIEVCNQYQTLQVAKHCSDNKISNKDDINSYKYYYDNDSYITINDMDNINLWLENIEKSLESQIISDLVYILNMDSSYLIRNEDGTLFDINNYLYDKANVNIGQTIYLNNFSNDIIEMFGLDSNELTFESTILNNGIINVTEKKDFKVTLKYKNIDAYSIDFVVEEGSSFNGGDGTIETPYLISNANQFLMINDDLNAHYKLMNDITFSQHSEYVSSFGMTINENNNDSITPFEGSLDGNGYKVSNLLISGRTATGLFSEIGIQGSIHDIIFDNFKVKSLQSDDNLMAYNETSKYSIGVICSTNNGSIYNCEVVNSEINIKRKNTTPDRIIEVYAGGIAGVNNGNINYCLLDGTSITAQSHHEYAAQEDAKNPNNLFVGGIAGSSNGIIDSCYVSKDNEIKATTKTYANAKKSTRYPRTTILVGGIAGKSNGELNNLLSLMTNDDITANFLIDNLGSGNALDNHCSVNKDPYVYNTNVLPNNNLKYQFDNIFIKDEYIINFSYNKKKSPDSIYLLPNNNDYYSKDQVLKAGEHYANFDNLIINVNGYDVYYDIINIYEFNSHNESFIEEMHTSVKLLFYAFVNDEYVFLDIEIPLLIEVNKIIGFEIEGLEDNYQYGELINKEDLSIKLHSQVPTDNTIKVDSSTDLVINGSTNTYGLTTIEFLYNDLKYSKEINVSCSHNYELNETIPSTCENIGYEIYKCSICRHTYLLNYTPKLNHYLIISGKKDSTCCDKGYTGDLVCKDCNKTIEKGEYTPTIDHNFDQYTKTKHYCSNDKCSKHNLGESHQFQVTESIVNDTLIYTFECIYCDYTEEKEDVKVVEDMKLPTVIVSDGYAKPGENEVVLYVQIINNPGIQGANFGITYDKRLTLKDPEDGNVLAETLTKSSKPIEYGYNFVWGNGKAIDEDGNLLKLTFVTPKNAKLDDEYKISLFYGINSEVNGGFLVDNSKKHFVTKDGTITIVDRLPGDVNNDNNVDLIDAILISNYLVGNGKIDFSVSDVNLDNSVDLEDLIMILQTLSGGFGTNLLSQRFGINLNYNGFESPEYENLDRLFANNGSITYGELLEILPEIEREGYLFEGWFKSIYSGDKINLEDKVIYDENQNKQTLYAHWVVNQVSFDDAEIYYYDENNYQINIPNVNYEYDVSFVIPKTKEESTSKLTFDVVEWIDQNGNTYIFNGTNFIDLSKPNIGKLILKPALKDGKLNIPNFEERGYQNDIIWYRTLKGNINGRYSFEEEVLTDEYHLLTEMDNIIIYGDKKPIEFRINFDANGGTGSMQSETTHRIDNVLPITTNQFVKKGYEFKQWKDNFGNTYENNEEIGYIDVAEKNPNIIFYAQWTPINYTINLNIPSNFESDINKYQDNSSIIKVYFNFDQNNLFTDKEYKVSLTDYLSTLKNKLLSYNFNYSGIYRNAIVDNGISTHKVDENNYEIIDINGNLIKDNLTNSLDNSINEINLYVNVLHVKKTLYFDLNESAGLIDNTLASFNNTGHDLLIDYNRNNHTYKLTNVNNCSCEHCVKSGRDINDPYCITNHTVHLIKDKEYVAHLLLKDINNNDKTGSIRVYLGIKNNFKEENAFTLTNDENYIVFKVNETGDYNIRLDHDTNGKKDDQTVIHNFWITEKFDYEIQAYYNETLPKITIPKDLYYKINKFVYGNNQIYDCDGNTTVKCIYDDNTTFNGKLTSDHSDEFHDYQYVSTYEEFISMKTSDKNMKYLLLCDLNLSGKNKIFDKLDCTFDGKNHKLSNWSFTHTTETNNLGLFKSISSSGKLKNLRFYNFTLKSDTNHNPTGTLNGGLVCGTLYGTIENVIVENSTIYIDMGSIDSECNNDTNVGGLVGKSIGGKVNKCGSVQNSVKGYAGTKYDTANCAAGGIIGKADGYTSLVDCYSYSHTLIQANPKRDTRWILGDGTAYGSSGALIGNTDGNNVEIIRCVAYNSNISTPDNDGYTNYFRGYMIGHINGSVSASNCYGASGYQILGGMNGNGEIVSLNGATRISTKNKISLDDLPIDFIKNGWCQDGDNLYIL